MITPSNAFFDFYSKLCLKSPTKFHQKPGSPLVSLCSIFGKTTEFLICSSCFFLNLSIVFSLRLIRFQMFLGIFVFAVEKRSRLCGGICGIIQDFETLVELRFTKVSILILSINKFSNKTIYLINIIFPTPPLNLQSTSQKFNSQVSKSQNPKTYKHPI